MGTDFKHHPELNAFVLSKDGINSFINYQIRDNVYVLWHSEVPVSHRGKGIGKELVEKTFEYLAENKIKAKATCSYITAIALKSSKWNELIQF